MATVVAILRLMAIEIMDDEQYLLERLKARKQRLLSDHTFLSEQTFLAVTQLSSEELEQMKTEQGILWVGDIEPLYPEFQLVDGQVSPILADSLPRLYESRSGWDICFWLFESRSVLLTRAVAGAEKLKGISLDKALEVGRQAKEQSERFNGLPIDALQQQKEEFFNTLIEAWINPDYRQIPKKPLGR